MNGFSIEKQDLFWVDKQNTLSKKGENMFNRIELKTNAKNILKKNYWWIVLVTLIFGMVSGESSGINLNLNFSGNESNPFSSYENSGISSGIFDEYGNIADTYSESGNGLISFKNSYKELYNEIRNMISGVSSMKISIFFIIFLIVLAITLVLSVFVLNPLHVGCKRWFLKNRKEKPEIGEIAHIFSHGYLNTVKVMFCKDLFIFLWSLLFIIPGIIKTYEYRMIPYLLAENPDMDMHEAFERSKKLMDGNKWDTFVLEISFFGWIILTLFTCGILSLLYVAPYMELTNTELYVCLCQGREQYTAVNNINQNHQENDDGFNNPYI